MNKYLRSAVCVAIAVAFSTSASATVIVDTGLSGSGGITDYYSTNYGGRLHGVAHAFTLAGGGAELTSVQGSISHNLDGITGRSTVSIYTDDGSGQGLGTSLFSNVFDHYREGPQYTWRGPTGLSWTLPAGNYWVTFESIYSTSPFRVYRGSFGGNAPMYKTDSGWVYDGIGSVGVNLQGNLIPEPGTILLLGSGLLGLVGFRLRRK